MVETSRNDYFLFLDFETTGDPDRKLLEVGWMLTTSDLEPLMEVQSVPIRQGNYIMTGEILAMHTKNGLIPEIVERGVNTLEAETRILLSIRPNQDIQARYTIAGFTIHYDRELITRDMPKLDSMLHYRHFDVSVLRAAYHYWVENIPSKKDQHPHRVNADVIAAWEIARTFRDLYRARMPKIQDLNQVIQNHIGEIPI